MNQIKLKTVFLLLIANLTLNCKSLVQKEEIEKTGKVSENFILESIDRGNPDPGDDKTIYYKIYLNRELAAKTTSGLFFQKKKLSLNLAPGRYLFFAERWYLEESQEQEVPEYKRANNVWQMKPIYIDISESPTAFTMVFGIDHDKKEFYYEIDGLEKSPGQVETGQDQTGDSAPINQDNQ